MVYLKKKKEKLQAVKAVQRGIQKTLCSGLCPRARGRALFPKGWHWQQQWELEGGPEHKVNPGKIKPELLSQLPLTNLFSWSSIWYGPRFDVSSWYLGESELPSGFFPVILAFPEVTVTKKKKAGQKGWKGGREGGTEEFTQRECLKDLQSGCPQKLSAPSQKQRQLSCQ